jgi:putative ABC transport system permease protein
MLTQIAWRNVWRNRTRSLTVIFAIALGLWATIFLVAFSWGMNGQRASYAIENQHSHIQLHHPEFREEQDVDMTIEDASAILASLKEDPEVRAVTGRLVVTGMVNSSKAGSGVQINGVVPDEEAEVTKLGEKLVEGKYFEGIRSNPILIGKKLAEKLKVGVRKKVVLTFQNAEGEIVAGAFRVAGIYQSINSRYDEFNVFVQRTDLNRILAEETQYHEIAMLLKDSEAVPAIKDSLAGAYNGLAVEDWGDLAPDLRMMEEAFDSYIRVFLVIIMLALAFGIINTMQMAVLERRHELGMLMSVGMNKAKIFGMIMLETVFFALIGGPLGILLAWLTIAYFGEVGINLSAFAEGLSSFGMENIAYPTIEPDFYVEAAIMIVITAMISAIFPALRALRLNPVESVRAI